MLNERTHGVVQKEITKTIKFNQKRVERRIFKRTIENRISILIRFPRYMINKRFNNHV